MKFAQADSNMNPVGDWPISRGRNLNNLGKYCKRIAARRRFLAKFSPDIPKYFRRTNDIIIYKYFITHVMTRNLKSTQ